MTINIYGGFYSARIRNGSNVTITTLPITITARDVQEAKNIALEVDRSKFLESEGWYDHRADVVVVTEEQLDCIN